MNQTRIVLAMAAFASALALGSAQAAVIPIAGVTASSTFYTYDAADLINGSGLTGALHDGDFHNKWMTDPGDHGLLVFDLGAVTALAGTSIWNYGGGCCGADRGARELHILGSVNGVVFSHIQYITLAETGSDPIPQQFFGFSADVRYVMFDILNNYGSSYTGLSEVQFESGRGVPEPATWALMLAGFGLAGAALRRRQTQTA